MNLYEDIFLSDELNKNDFSDSQLLNGDVKAGPLNDLFYVVTAEGSRDMLNIYRATEYRLRKIYLREGILVAVFAHENEIYDWLKDFTADVKKETGNCNLYDFIHKRNAG